MDFGFIRQEWRRSAWLRAFWYIAAPAILFAVFSAGVERNPPGYYLDESALSYNAYLVSQSGAGESGTLFPLYFPVYTEVYTQYANPTHVYLLAAVFKVFGPGIGVARTFAAFCVFTACLLLALLARRISESSFVGWIVLFLAISTPWMFEVGRLVLETFFYPFALVLLLWSIYRASQKSRWRFLDSVLITASLILLTYSYTIGRLLGPLLALGLALFATSRVRIYSILRVWIIYAFSLLPLLLYIKDNPAITARFRVLSYFASDATLIEKMGMFLTRFGEDINPLSMLVKGDINPRHHLPSPDGSFYFAVFILSLVGLMLTLRSRSQRPWRLFVVYGSLVSIIPGALTNDPFHSLRLIAYPIFLLTLTIPAVTWLLGSEPANAGITSPVSSSPRTSGDARPSVALRHSILAALLTMTLLQAGHFFWNYYKEGWARSDYFDASYKLVYDDAVSQPQRPVYLVDGYWGPAYIHAYWYAVLEGRDRSEFVHVPNQLRPPVGSVVLSSERDCGTCELIRSEGGYLLYIESE